MGIFSNRCEALVNPVTGKALYGAELEEARKNPNWPRCGASVKKTAHVCSACGAPAPGGWWRCPACKKWVGNDSHFCPHCNAPLHPDERAAVAGGVWQKTPDVFAQRFEVVDIKKLGESGLQVQEGTTAILLDAGAVSDVLDAGQYNLESIARKINWFGAPPPRSVVLLDSGEVALPISFENVLTKKNEKVEFLGEVIVRFVGGKAAAVNFVSNILKDRRSLTFSDIVDRFDPLFRMAVADICSESTLDELVHDRDRRAKLRDTISRMLEDDLHATGLDVVRVSAGEFTSPEYERRLEELVKQERQRQLEELERQKDLEEHEKEKRHKEIEQLKAADILDMRKRDTDLEAAQEAFEREVMLGKFKSEQELRLAKEALEDEYNLKEMERRDNWKRLMEQRADEASARQREREKIERAYREQMEEEERQKTKIQLVREEKEREEADIRRNAALDRRWQLENKLNTHSREEEIRRFREAEDRRAMRWEAIKDEAQRLWEKKKEEWRREDERRAREKQIEVDDVLHQIKIDDIQTDAAISKRSKITDALNDEIIKKAQADIAVKKLLSDGEIGRMLAKKKADAEARIIDAQGAINSEIVVENGNIHIKDMQLTQEVKEHEAWRRQKIEEKKELESERDRLRERNDKLRNDLAGNEDKDARASINEEMEENLKRITTINEQLKKLSE